MKLKSLLRLLSLALVLPVLCLAEAATAEVKAEAKKKPTLSVDATPIAQGVKPGLVASYADVVEPVQKTVVSVYSTKTVHQRVNPLFRQFFGEMPDVKEEGLGSGVIVSPDGYILTNNHVVEGADELKVLLTDDREFIAKVIGADPKTDIAVIKIDAENLPTITLADSDKLRVGDVVFAVGNPLKVGQTVTMGIVSALGRRFPDDESQIAQPYQNFIQTDAAINMGNSGGALVDARGRLVGVNSAIISTSGGNIGIGFAIPINLAASIMHSLIETGTVQRGMLGVSGDNLTPELAETLGLKKDQRGVVVMELRPEDGPAAKAGLKREDVIMSINDKPVNTLQDLRLLVAQMTPGTTVKVKFLRAAKEQVVEVKLGKLDADVATDELLEGIKATGLDEEYRKQNDIDKRINGLVVTEVDPKSPYHDRLAVGVIILEINRQPVKTVLEARAALAKGNNLLYIYYRGLLRYISIKIR
ncbi:MAG TPA: Do family serine endopeptidase [Opitutaceae bacterium]|nr:Do family serine endopeptidase [Opitutaceae bacterium]